MTRHKPDDRILEERLNELGSKKAVSEYYGVGYNTAKRWYAAIDARKEDDLVAGSYDIDSSPKPSLKFKEHPIILKNHKFDLSELFSAEGLGKNDVYKMVWVPDTHYPDHDARAFAALKKFLRDYQPHGIGCLGDWVENKGVGHWNQNSLKDAVTLMKEAKAFMRTVLEAAGNPTLRIITLGNHEAWMEEYIESKVPYIREYMAEVGKDISAVEICGMKELGFKAFPYNEVVSIGHASFTHGCYTSDHHAKAHLNVVGSNIFYGHCETVQAYSGTSLKGIHIAQCAGTMRDIEAPAFLRNKPTSWVNAFLIIEFQSNGLFTYYNPMIIDGSFCFNGKVYKA